MADVVAVERRPVAVDKHPLRHRLPRLQAGRLARAVKLPQRLGQLQRHIDASPVGILRGREAAGHKVAPDLEKPPSDIDVAPLKREELAQADPGTERAEEERVILWYFLADGLEELMRFEVRPRVADQGKERRYPQRAAVVQV
jgi:hypothetical protein